MSLKLNERAPDFKLFNTQKQEVSLSDNKGKNVVLLFFPFAFSGTCTKELCSVRDSFNIYGSLNAVVYGISVDSVFALGKFKEDQRLDFELLSDFNKEVMAAYGVFNPQFVFGTKGVAKRSAFVIDKEGVLKYLEVVEVAGELPNFDAIQSCLKGLK